MPAAAPEMYEWWVNDGSPRLDDLPNAHAWFGSLVFYILVFGLLAFLLVVAGLTVMSRNRSRAPAQAHSRAVHTTTTADRRQRKQKRAQSRHDRRKRH
jgi:hypothetical protein